MSSTIHFVDGLTKLLRGDEGPKGNASVVVLLAYFGLASMIYVGNPQYK